MASAARMAALAAAALCSLTACQREPDFDERYEAAEKTINKKAAELDSAIAKADRQRAAQAAADPSVEGPAGGDDGERR